jgi:hypothetical protein
VEAGQSRLDLGHGAGIEDVGSWGRILGRNWSFRKGRGFIAIYGHLREGHGWTIQASSLGFRDPMLMPRGCQGVSAGGERGGTFSQRILKLECLSLKEANQFKRNISKSKELQFQPWVYLQSELFNPEPGYSLVRYVQRNVISLQITTSSHLCHQRTKHFKDLAFYFSFSLCSSSSSSLHT